MDNNNKQNNNKNNENKKSHINYKSIYALTTSRQKLGRQVYFGRWIPPGNRVEMP